MGNDFYVLIRLENREKISGWINSTLRGDIISEDQEQEITYMMWLLEGKDLNRRQKISPNSSQKPNQRSRKLRTPSRRNAQRNVFHQFQVIGGKKNQDSWKFVRDGVRGAGKSML